MKNSCDLRCKEEMMDLIRNHFSAFRGFLKSCGFVFCEKCGKIITRGYHVDGLFYCDEHCPLSGGEIHRRALEENGFLLFSEGTDGEVEFVKAFNECLEEVNHVRE